MERNLKLFAFCFLMAVGAPHTQFVEAQTLKKEIRIEADNQAMPQVLKQLEKKSGYKILFTNECAQRHHRQPSAGIHHPAGGQLRQHPPEKHTRRGPTRQSASSAGV